MKKKLRTKFTLLATFVLALGCADEGKSNAIRGAGNEQAGQGGSGGVGNDDGAGNEQAGQGGSGGVGNDDGAGNEQAGQGGSGGVGNDDGAGNEQAGQGGSGGVGNDDGAGNEQAGQGGSGGVGNDDGAGNEQAGQGGSGGGDPMIPINCAFEEEECQPGQNGCDSLCTKVQYNIYDSHQVFNEQAIPENGFDIYIFINRFKSDIRAAITPLSDGKAEVFLADYSPVAEPVPSTPIVKVGDVDGLDSEGNVDRLETNNPVFVSYNHTAYTALIIKNVPDCEEDEDDCEENTPFHYSLDFKRSYILQEVGNYTSILGSTGIDTFKVPGNQISGFSIPECFGSAREEQYRIEITNPEGQNISFIEPASVCVDADRASNFPKANYLLGGGYEIHVAPLNFSRAPRNYTLQYTNPCGNGLRQIDDSEFCDGEDSGDAIRCDNACTESLWTLDESGFNGQSLINQDTVISGSSENIVFNVSPEALAITKIDAHFNSCPSPSHASPYMTINHPNPQGEDFLQFAVPEVDENGCYYFEGFRPRRAGEHTLSISSAENQTIVNYAIDVNVYRDLGFLRLIEGQHQSTHDDVLRGTQDYKFRLSQNFEGRGGSPLADRVITVRFVPFGDENNCARYENIQFQLHSEDGTLLYDSTDNRNPAPNQNPNVQSGCVGVDWVSAPTNERLRLRIRKPANLGQVQYRLIFGYGETAGVVGEI